MSHRRTAAIRACFAMTRLESGLTFTLATRRKRSMALSATGWVMKMRGRIRPSTARCRQRRRPRPATRPGCGWWPRARPAPSGCRARARARQDATWSLRAPRPRLRGVKTRGADRLCGHRLQRGAVAAALAVVLAAGLDLAQKTLAREHDAVRDHLALRNGGAQSPRRADEHSPRGGLAQAAARDARVDERLNEHGHGRLGRRASVAFHAAARIRGPQRGPAGAHGGEQCGLVVDAEKALELAGEIAAFAILDQG